MTEHPAAPTPETEVVMRSWILLWVPADQQADALKDLDAALDEARAAARKEVDPDALYAAILDELAELWGEPSDAVSKAVRPQVARSIATRYLDSLSTDTREDDQP